MSRRGRRGQDQAERRRLPEPRQYANHIDLGELGEEREALDVTFSWFGATVRVNPELSDLMALDFAEEVADNADLDPESAEALAMMKRSMREYIHPDDFGEFWRLARANRQNTGDLMRAMQRIVEGMTGLPTGARSDFSPGSGPRAIGSTSTARSSGRVAARLESEGRPDLALVVMEAEEHRASRAG